MHERITAEPFMIQRAAIILLLSALILAGCARQPSRPSAQATPATAVSAHTMIVSAARGPLADNIRQTLSSNGWRLAEYHSAGASNTPADAQAMAQRARYRLTLTASSAGACRSGEPSFMYRLSVIENASGKVPLAMSGADCVSAIKQQFQQELAEDGLSPRSKASTERVPAAQ